MARCSIVIPVYGRAAVTARCLDVLLSSPGERTDFQIVVVDDGSPDDTAEVLAGYGDRIRVVTHETNSGFAQACNDGAAVATGKFLVFLNNDTIPQPGWLDALVDYAERHPRAAVVGSKLLSPDGTVQHAGVVVCQDRYIRHLYAGFPGDHQAVNKSRRFQVVTAASALVRREAFEQAKGFDTVFRNCYEDIDLCLRLGELGYEVHYCHESVLTHLESVSEGRFVHVLDNDRIYRERWAEKVRPDDVQYWIEDGLFGLEYWEAYPVRLSVSPELAVLQEEERERLADRLLDLRARQAFELLRENIRLGLQVQEARFRAPVTQADGRQTTVLEPELLFDGEARWMAQEPSGRLVSVVVPVRDGAATLPGLLQGIASQEISDTFEIVAFDFGSTDGTVDLLRRHGCRVVSVGDRSLDDDLARGLVGRFVRGEVIVFLQQDMRLEDRRWLVSLLESLDGGPDLDAVSRRLPRDGAEGLATAVRLDSLAFVPLVGLDGSSRGEPA